jgi:RNA polymerase sigma factor (sigma-70 family)
MAVPARDDDNGAISGVILVAPEGLQGNGSNALLPDSRWRLPQLPAATEGCPMDDPVERFADLYDRYYRNVLRYSLQHAEQASAEDLASETFLIAWRRLSDLPDPPLPWLLGVARNLLRKQAEADRRRRQLADRIATLASAADLIAWDAGEHVVERDTALHALASLPGRDAEAMTLVTWHGLDVAEAAAVLGCSPRAFTVKLHRARRRLTAALHTAEEAGNRPARRSADSTVPRVAQPGPPAGSTPKDHA